MLERLKDIKISIAIGENQFSMKRGSFRYRQKIWLQAELKRRNLVQTIDGFDLELDKDSRPYTFSVREQDGFVRAELIQPETHKKYNRFSITFPVEKDLHFYGCGELHSHFDLRGEKIRIFVAEHQNTNRIGRKLLRAGLLMKRDDKVRPLDEYESYYVQPTFTTSGKWFFHAETKGFSEFDFSVPGQVTFHTQEPPVFWLGEAETYPDLSEKLTSLIGRQAELPDWIYDGAILAVQEGCEVIDRKIKAAEKAGAKVCGIWSQDWCGCRRTGFGYQVMWNWQWDRELYVDLDEKIRAWKEKGIRFLGYINPFLAIEQNLYKYATEHGYCVKDKNGEDYLVTITTFPAAMIDLTNPDAWDWYKTIIKDNMIGLGMGGWMADFGEYLPTDCVLSSGEDPEKLHNQWPAMWARLNREAIEESGKQGEVFFFTRAGYTETPKYSPMMWTGDQHVDWSVDDGLPSVIPATLSLAMSGFGITHSDVGGYTTVSRMTRSKELLLRWEEMNAFSPLFRFHEGNQPSRNVQFDADEELLQQLAKFSSIHAALKPYLKTLEKENTEKGTPVMRPLFYHYEEAAAYTDKTEYFLGRDILVTPVLKNEAVSREVWLPDDHWVHLFTKEEYEGGTHTVSAPIGTPPVFIRKESPAFESLMNIINGETV
ncbi:MAG: alpha-glucosidase [Lachnospiraceae bacterium]|nr:alpha-glucosidase [Lachnospiraceae bacterium]